MIKLDQRSWKHEKSAVFLDKILEESLGEYVLNFSSFESVQRNNVTKCAVSNQNNNQHFKIVGIFIFGTRLRVLKQLNKNREN